jgi:hypothetical protein
MQHGNTKHAWHVSSGIGIFALLVCAFASTPARADCEKGIAALTASIAQVSDTKLKAMLQTDLRRAQVELWEFDEEECADALDHAKRLLSTAKQASNAPAANPQ